MSEKLTATLVGRNKESADSIMNLLDGFDWLEANSHIASNGHADLLRGLNKLPDILIVDLSHLWNEELEALNRIPANERPNIIVVGNEVNTEFMRGAMQIGARDFFAHPVDAEGFEECLEKISKERLLIKEEKNAKIISFINGKGGSGSTMLASNLAYTLSEKHNKRVALLDLHCGVTSLNLYFDINIAHTLVDVLTSIDSLDELGLEGSMVKYSERLHILTSKNNVLNNTIRIGETSLKKLISLAAETYDFIIVDLPTTIDAGTTFTLNRSDNIFLVTQQSIPHVSESALIYNHLVKEQAILKENIHIIVNRYDSKDAIRIDDIKNNHGENIITVPSDYKAVTYSLNVGRPLYSSSVRGAVSKSIVRMSDDLTNSESKSQEKNWIKPFSGLFTN